jgi:hypothetical protein
MTPIGKGAGMRWDTRGWGREQDRVIGTSGDRKTKNLTTDEHG